MRQDKIIITSDVTGKEYVFPKPADAPAYPQLWKLEFNAVSISSNGTESGFGNSARYIHVEREVLDIVGIISPRETPKIPIKEQQTVEQEIAETLSNLLRLMGVCTYADVH
jgi:hypothetical protein